MTTQDDSAPRGPRLFVLGAGFSKPAGLPLANDLLEPVLAEVRRSARVSGGTKLDKSIDRYRAFLVATTGVEPERLNFEELATYLDHEHFLGLRGGDTWSEEGNEDQLMLRWGVGAVLNRMTPAAGAIPELYIDFAQQLRRGDVVLTFNYDLLLERSLEAAGVPFRRFPRRYTACYETFSEVDSEWGEDEVIILKLHGSVDWVSRAQFEHYYEVPRSDLDRDAQARFRDRHRVFGSSPCTTSHQLVEGPRPDGDPLSDVYVLGHPDDYYADFSTWLNAAPLLLIPSQAKLYYGAPLREFWSGMTQNTTTWETLAVVGYSLPPGDPYAKQVLYELAAGHVHALQRPGWCPWPQFRIKVVDYRTNERDKAEFFENYRFLDRQYTEFDFGGLSTTSVARLFATDRVP
jgi:hypothetical protein